MGFGNAGTPQEVRDGDYQQQGPKARVRTEAPTKRLAFSGEGVSPRRIGRPCENGPGCPGVQAVHAPLHPSILYSFQSTESYEVEKC